MTQPKVIFLDAVGTLFGVRGSVGEIYSAIAANFDVTVTPEALETAFYHSFKTSPPLAFPEIPESEIPEAEYNWWRKISENTFNQAGVLEKFSNFNGFFQKLYQYFATDKPWYIYDDVIPTLEYWQKQKIKLAIISNFDSRIYQVLKSLDLDKFFSSITISSVTGVAKPDSKIFVKALRQYDCSSQETWHIGDSYLEDYEGALSVGIQPFLVKRPHQSLATIANLK